MEHFLIKVVYDSFQFGLSFRRLLFITHLSFSGRYVQTMQIIFPHTMQWYLLILS